MALDFDPRRTGIRPREGTDAARTEAGTGTGRATRPSAAELRSWLPVVRRHAIRAADKARGAVTVAELCHAGVHGLVEAIAVTGSGSCTEESAGAVEAAVLLAIRDHLRGLLEQANATARDAAPPGRAEDGLERLEPPPGDGPPPSPRRSALPDPGRRGRTS